MKQLSLFCLAVIFTFTTTAQHRYFYALLTGADQVPATPSAGSGVVIVKYNTTTRLLELVGDYQNLGTAANASHIHSPAPAGANAGVILNLTNTGGTTGTLDGSGILTAAQETDLYNTLMYVNVHTTTYPGGEIRGQLLATTVNNTDFLTARLQGAQEVPPNSSVATGSAFVLSDKTAGMVYLTGRFSGLTSALTATHIHIGNAGSNGGVLVPLTGSAATSGTIHGFSSMTAVNQGILQANGMYVNIHSGTYPGGELRGQLIPPTQMMYFKTTLSGANEVPPNASTATGNVIVKYNTNTKLLELIGDYQNLSVAVTASHIHSPAAAGVNAPVLIGLTHSGGTSGTISGSATLTIAQETDMLNGLFYVNVHTSNFPGGEVRGQLSSTSAASETFFYFANMTGSQENPANASTATGSVNVLLDKITRQVYVTGNFSGLASNATASHLHRGITGTNGPVVVPLTATAATAGSITGTATISATFMDSLLNGQAYSNVHNATFPGGEIRAQLGNQVLPVQLNLFSGYKKNNNVELTWVSQQEINMASYDIEQQVRETGSWMKKANIMANGSSVPFRYNYSDVPFTDNSNYVYYRLKMIDRDGRFTYSPVIKINFKQLKPELQISVNPVRDNNLLFTISGLVENKTAAVSIVDYNGKTVLRTSLKLSPSNSIDISRLSKGMYVLSAIVDGEVIRQNFIK